MVRTIKKKRKRNLKLEIQKREIEESMQELDPRRREFAELYLNKESPTYANALQSAIRAGFEYEYAKRILASKPIWLSEIISKRDILNDLVRNFNDHVNLDPVVPAMGPFGPLINKKTNKPYMVVSNTRLKMRQEITMFGLEKLHPDFRKKKEVESNDQPVAINNIIILPANGKTREEAISEYKEIQQ